MSNPQTKRMHKKVIADREVRAAIKKAFKEGSVNVVLDAKPCSLEISRSTSGILSWKAKLYTKDARETLDSVSMIAQIESEIKRSFK